MKVELDLAERVRLMATARAAQDGYPSIDAYVQALIVADSVCDVAGPEHLEISSQPHLSALLDESKASAARPMTQADWSDMRRQLIDRHSASRGS